MSSALERVADEDGAKQDSESSHNDALNLINIKIGAKRVNVNKQI